MLGSKSQPPYKEHVPVGNPPVLVLTVLDTTKYTEAYLQTIRDNREQYAQRHGKNGEAEFLGCILTKVQVTKI